MIDRLFRPHRRWHRLISDAVTGECSPSDAARLEAHLAGCPACRNRLEEERELQRSLRALPLLAPSRSLRLTPAQVAAPAPARPARPGVPPALVYGARGVAAAAVLLFAAVATVTLTGDSGEDRVSTAARDADAGVTLMSTEAPEAAATDTGAPLASPVAEPTPVPGVASPPPGGAVGAGATEGPGAFPVTPGPAGEPQAPAAPGEAEATGKRAGDDARGGEPSVVTFAAGPAGEPREARPRWPLFAAGAFAAAALTALGAVEFSRRRRA